MSWKSSCEKEYIALCAVATSSDYTLRIDLAVRDWARRDATVAKRLRRLNTVHSLFSFSFNTVILALTINLLAGLFA